VSAAGPPDVLLVSLGSTTGLRVADEQLREALTAAGAQVALARARPPRAVRTLMLTDLAWSRAARSAAREALCARGRTPAPAVIYSSTTAALLWPLAMFTLLSGALAFLAPQIPGIAAGFAIIWALAWRQQDAAVAAIEERDGAAFYVEQTSPVRAISLVRTPGFSTSRPERINGAVG
jgi:hypothetical protein